MFQQGGTVWRNNRTVHGETVWWNSGTVVVEQCGGTVEQYGKTVKQ